MGPELHVSGTLLRLQKMNDVEEDGAEYLISSCVSVITDHSKNVGPYFSNEPGASDTNQRAESPISSWVSGKSNCSKESPPYFSDEPGPSNVKKWISYGDQYVSSGERSRTRAGLQTDGQTSSEQTERGLQEHIDEQKISLRTRCERVTQGDDAGKETLLNDVFTELHMAEGLSEEVKTRHEVKRLEKTIEKKKVHHDTQIQCCDIFKTSTGPHERIRVVLTVGIAGVGKTFSVQKFTLDWAEGLQNQDVGLLIPLPFGDLNLIREERFSLLRLIHIFHPALRRLTAEQLTSSRALFVLDGLDQNRHPLDFNSKKVVSNAAEESPIGDLLANLVKGDLLPSALVWITSRPAAVGRIPPALVDMLTEVRGFTDAQKDEYFRRRFSDADLCSRVVSHVKSRQGLRVMCQVPAFCWISASVLEHMLSMGWTGELVQTLEDVYSRFLLLRTERRRYDGGT